MLPINRKLLKIIAFKFPISNFQCAAMYVCMCCRCRIFEEHLKRQQPAAPQITYDVAQLFEFIDQLADLCALVVRSHTPLAHTHSIYIHDSCTIFTASTQRTRSLRCSVSLRRMLACSHLSYCITLYCKTV